MKKLLASILLAVSALVTSCSASALQLVDGKPVLDAREVELLKHCEEQGGCAVVSRQMVLEFLQVNLERALNGAAEAIKDAETACRRKI